MTCYILRWFTRQQTVTHPNTNPAQCRLTSLIKPTPLTTTLRCHPSTISGHIKTNCQELNTRSLNYRVRSSLQCLNHYAINQATTTKHSNTGLSVEPHSITHRTCKPRVAATWRNAVEKQARHLSRSQHTDNDFS